jgi:putative OPT family oligopeptide transporter
VLPDNAFRELKPGETYEPVVPASQSPPEVTARSVVMGLISVVVFTFAAAYIGLKTGNVIETAIPIALLAVFFGNLFARRSTLLENVIIQSIGQASGVVVAGAIFTIPALYVNELEPDFWHIFFSCALGGFLGVVLLIPLRRYFVRDLHGQLPFPEATAIVNVLASGEQAKGSSGKVLLYAFGLGFLYDLFVEFIHLWNGHLSTGTAFHNTSLGNWLEARRFEFNLNATAVYFGLGYIIGPRYAGIIAAGSVLSFLVLVPMVYFVGGFLDQPLTPPMTDTLIANMEADEIFTLYVRPIGIGCIAVAGFIGIGKMWRIVFGSMSLAFKGLTGRVTETEGPRTDTDISPRNVLLIQIASVFGMFLLFWWISGSAVTALIGAVITFVLAFLFTPVAARAIAIVGVNPVSGMTLITIILAASILAGMGLGRANPALGQTVALIVGAAVCTALATSGAFVSDLKIGFWTGASPFKQERWKYLGVLVAALSVGVIIWMLNNAYGFLVPSDADPSVMVVNDDLPAPQGNLMAAIVQGVIGGEAQPFFLYGLGGLIAVMLEMAAVPALAFGLGMYLPIEINMAVFAGALIGHFISKSGPTAEVKAARASQGTLIASGLMAGAAIMGTVGAAGMIDLWLLIGLTPPMQHIDLPLVSETFRDAYWTKWPGQLVSLIAFAGLAYMCYLLARKGADWELKGDKQ